MEKNFMSVEFGTNQIKLLLGDSRDLRRVVTVPTPDHLVSDGVISSFDAMAELLRQACRENKLKARACAAVLPRSLAFTRCTNLPVMSAKQLELNLPYEFRDYITQGKEKYQYDYAVLNMAAESMDLMACAALKTDILQYQDMFRAAGLKLERLLPEEFAYRNLMLRLASGSDQPLCLIDLGHAATRVHIFVGERYEITRVIELGGAAVDDAIAEQLGIDSHLARVKKESDQDGVTTLEACRDIYRAIAAEITRCVNFYGYDSGTELKNACVVGGGAGNRALMQELSQSTGLALMTGLPGDLTRCIDAAAALGALWQ